MKTIFFNKIRSKKQSNMNGSKTDIGNYDSSFIKKSDILARTGKAVNIRPEFHEKITIITHVIGMNRITIFDYIDNVLANHFETMKEEIAEKYNKNKNNIF